MALLSQSLVDMNVQRGEVCDDIGLVRVFLRPSRLGLTVLARGRAAGGGVW